MRVVPAGCSITLFVLLGFKVVCANPLPHFAANAVWNRDISNAPLAANSATMISTLATWGNGNTMQIDFSMHVVYAAANSPTRQISPITGYYAGDCDTAAAVNFPMPVGGAIEGSTNYTCNIASDDCHLLVVQGNILYESYKSNLLGTKLQSICVVHWDLSKIYPPEGRGDQCTSADAAGFPIAPLLFNADEVAAALGVNNSDIGHAIRFILPNDHMAASRYVHPGTHTTSATSGSLASVPYGSRLRLHSNFDMSHYNAAAQVLLRTMQRYGIVLSDGGNIALTAENDLFTTHKWADANIDIDSHAFSNDTSTPVQVSDFDVIETGPQHILDDCNKRTPDDFIYIDHFDY
jgi:hypothetical protein